MIIWTFIMPYRTCLCNYENIRASLPHRLTYVININEVISLWNLPWTYLGPNECYLPVPKVDLVLEIKGSHTKVIQNVKSPHLTVRLINHINFGLYNVFDGEHIVVYLLFCIKYWMRTILCNIETGLWELEIPRDC